MILRAFSLLFLYTAILPGCTALKIGKPSRVAEEPINLPTLWAQSSLGTEGKIATGWLETFRDKELDKLVDEAMQHNNDLRATAARLRSAREGTITGRSNRLPEVSASGSGSRSGSRFRREDDGDLSDWEQNSIHGLSLNASWEIDLWGRLRNLEEASINDYLSTQADFRGARLSLAANTARAWSNLITARKLVESAELTQETFERNFRITERNLMAGDATALNVIFGRNEVASSERNLRDRRLTKDEAARSLEVLLGRYPNASIEGSPELPYLPDKVPAGLPSELLMRRPDLVSAVARLRSSAARADASRKALLPSIRLNGGGSTSSDDLLKVIADPRSIAWNVAASLAQTVYRGGAPTAQARQALAQNEASIESFASTALRAFREVESALARDRNLAEQEKTTKLEMETANKAQNLADRGFQEQLVSPLELLEARRRVISARNSMISLANQRLQNRIDLHLALGGDFSTPTPSNDETRNPRS